MNTAGIETTASNGVGAPRVRGTNLSLHRLLSLLADGSAAEDIASEYGIDQERISNALLELAVLFDRDFTKGMAVSFGTWAAGAVKPNQ